MDSITQKDSFGCSIACVAFVLRVDYKKSKSLFDNHKRSKNFGFLCREIIKTLQKRGLNYGYKYIKHRIRKKIYKPGTIVFIKKSKKYPSGHYLCRTTNKKWMDPWINFPSDIKEARSGFRKRLPDRAIYVIFPK